MEVRKAFVEGKKTYIGRLEFLWGHSPYASVPGEFVGQLAIHFIDNTSAVSGFVKGYARPVDSAMIVHADKQRRVWLLGALPSTTTCARVRTWRTCRRGSRWPS